MDEFLSQIKSTMFLYQMMLNQLIDKAEDAGFYPTEELGALDATRRRLVQDYKSSDENIDKVDIWNQLCDINDILKDKKANKMADDLWKILEDIELFNTTYYPET